MTHQLSAVMNIAVAKSRDLTKEKNPKLHRVALQNQFVKYFNGVLVNNPLWLTVDDVELSQSSGTPVQKKRV